MPVPRSGVANSNAGTTTIHMGTVPGARDRCVSNTGSSTPETPSKAPETGFA